MTQEQIFSNIESLWDILATYQTTGYVKVSVEQQLLLRDTYRMLYPDVVTQLGCSTCILQYLNMLVAYYEREYPKSQNIIEPKEFKKKKK